MSEKSSRAFELAAEFVDRIRTSFKEVDVDKNGKLEPGLDRRFRFVLSSLYFAMFCFLNMLGKAHAKTFGKSEFCRRVAVGYPRYNRQQALPCRRAD